MRDGEAEIRDAREVVLPIRSCPPSYYYSLYILGRDPNSLRFFCSSAFLYLLYA